MKKATLNLNEIVFNPANPNPNNTSLESIKVAVQSEGWNQSKGRILVEKVGDEYVTLQGNNRLGFLQLLDKNGLLKSVTGSDKVHANVVENLTELERLSYVYDVSASKRIEEYYCLQEINDKKKVSSSNIDLACLARGAFEAVLSPQSVVKFKENIAKVLAGDLEGVADALLAVTRGWTQKAEYVFCGSKRLKAMQWDSSYGGGDTPDTMLNLGRAKCAELAKAYKKDGNEEGENFERLWAEYAKPVVKKYQPRFIDKKDYATLLAGVQDQSLKRILDLLLLKEGEKSQENVGQMIQLANAFCNVDISEKAENAVNMVTELDAETSAKLDALS